MVKAFNEFQVRTPNEVDNQQSDGENDTDSSSDAEDDHDESDPATVDTSHVLEQSCLCSADDGVSLPPHLRCCIHTLNLVATTDAKKACSVRVSGNRCAVGFRKCTVIG